MISGKEVEAGGMEYFLDRQSKNGTNEKNRVQRVVQIRLGAADGVGSQYTEGEGDGSRKKSNGTTGYKTFILGTEPRIGAVSHRGWKITTS